MKTNTSLTAAVCCAALAMWLSHAAPARADDDDDDRGGGDADLLGANEVPPVVTGGDGEFDFDFRRRGIEFELEYDVESGGSDVTQAHIHVANPGNNGGIAVFLCTNLGNNPPGATLRPCPRSPGEVEGTIVAGDVQTVLGANGIIIEAGDLEGLRRLMDGGATYVNVHTDAHPPGEVRGQTNPRER